MPRDVKRHSFALDFFVIASDIVLVAPERISLPGMVVSAAMDPIALDRHNNQSHYPSVKVEK
jgi:hypothetical protein